MTEDFEIWFTWYNRIHRHEVASNKTKYNLDGNDEFVNTVDWLK